jgi:hypothetical protein
MTRAWRRRRGCWAACSSSARRSSLQTRCVPAHTLTVKTTPPRCFVCLVFVSLCKEPLLAGHIHPRRCRCDSQGVVFPRERAVGAIPRRPHRCDCRRNHQGAAAAPPRLHPSVFMYLFPPRQATSRIRKDVASLAAQAAELHATVSSAQALGIGGGGGGKSVAEIVEMTKEIQALTKKVEKLKAQKKSQVPAALTRCSIPLLTEFLTVLRFEFVCSWRRLRSCRCGRSLYPRCAACLRKLWSRRLSCRLRRRTARACARA